MRNILNILVIMCLSISVAKAESVSLKFFADENYFTIEERKHLVEFLKKHKENNKYEFELLTLKNPLEVNLDNARVKSIQALFRQYDIDLNGLLSAKIKFIASDEQKLLIIRK